MYQGMYPSEDGDMNPLDTKKKGNKKELFNSL